MKAGRKCKYETNIKPYFEKIKHWLQHGCDELAIAKALDINHDTWCRYKKRFPEFYELVTTARISSNLEVKSALYKLCIGYEYTEQSVTVDGDGKRQVTEHKKKNAPLLGACIFWLTNRNREEWENTQKQILSGEIKGLNIADLVKRVALKKKARAAAGDADQQPTG